MDNIDDSMDIYSIDYADLVKSCCQDLNCITDLLTKLTSSYNILINSADGFNKNSFAKKDDVDDAVHRAKKLGRVIDKVIDALEIETLLYVDIIAAKEEYININCPLNDIVRSEIEHYIVKTHKINSDGSPKKEGK